MKRKFTLIELIVVIAIIGMLAVIVIPNIRNITGKANSVAIVSDLKNIQTAVDMYALDHNSSSYPVLNEQPTEMKPEAINFDNIYPKYLSNLPKVEGIKYWIDYKGKVWASTIDAPKDLNINDNSETITWTAVQNAEGYKIYLLDGYLEDKVTSAVNNKTKLRYIATVKTNSYEGEKGKTYIISAIGETSPT